MNLSDPTATTLDQLPVIVIVLVNSVIRYSNPAAQRLLEADQASDLFGKSVLDFVHPMDQSRTLVRLQKWNSGEVQPPGQFRVLSLKGTMHMLLTSSTLIDFQQEQALLITCIDMTEQSRMEDELRQSEMQFRTLFENLQDVYYRTDAKGVVQMVGPAVRKVIGYEPQEIIGHTAEAYYPSPSDRDALKMALQMHGQVNDFPGQMVHKDGRTIDISISSRVLFDSAGNVTGVEGVYRDVTQRKNLERELLRLATTDTLTGIDNRRAFLNKSEQIFKASQRYQRRITLVMLDIDHFKQINDRFGHLGGDRVLIHFASIIQYELRDSDLFGRLGGEEFCVLLQQVDQQEAQSVCERIRQKIQDAVMVPVTDKALSITVSLGVSSNHASDDVLERILERADNALYLAKRGGRNRIEWET